MGKITLIFIGIGIFLYCYDDLKKAQEKVAAEEIKLLKMTGTKSNQ